VLVLIAIVLSLIPAAAILYPFLRKSRDALPEHEYSTHSELSQRWDSALTGLKSTELEWAIGNLTEDDYRWLREQYMTDAARTLKAMDLEEQHEQEMLASIEREVLSQRQEVVSTDGSGPDLDVDR
jgi:hypothetical protein